MHVVVARDACPTAPDDLDVHGAEPGTAGLANVYVPGGGRYCVSLWSRDTYGRLSAPASVWIDVPGDEAAEEPLEPNGAPPAP